MLTLAELVRMSQDHQDSHETFCLWVQIEQLKSAQTQSNKPYYDLDLVDSTQKAKIKIWSDTQAFDYCSDSFSGDVCELEGSFFINQWGLNVSRPSMRRLGKDERRFFFAGSPERVKKNEEDWTFLVETFSDLKEKRLRAVTTLCLGSYEAKWRRAAAARSYHHARRGGLLEHTSQMLRCAKAIAPLYDEVMPDLLYAGVLFHDVGKLWENDYGEEGFVLRPTRTGELIGHIAIGIEAVNRLWREAAEAEPDLFQNASPSSVLLRDHLLHLIACHHGEHAFGAPVTPRTPEGWILHYIDNMDARVEMLRGAYLEKPEVVEGLYEARRPLSGLLAKPLGSYIPVPETSQVVEE